MTWVGLLVGGLVAWFVSELLGVHGLAFVVFGAAVGAVLARQQGRIAALGERIDQIERQAVGAPAAPLQARRDAAQAKPAPEPEPVPTAPAKVEPRPVPMSKAVAPPVEVDESSPSVTTSLGQSLVAWFKGGNTIVRVAVLLLFIGVAFLLRYAAEHALLPLEARLGLVALGGLALAGVGWRLRDKRRGYALSLQGAGVGIVYLTLFAAFRLYQLVPAGLTFALLVVLAGVTALLAVLQNAMPLALIGFGGGFLAPVLASTGSGSHVALFSYYLVLNLAIAWIANRQTWKPLNLMAFLFTFGIGAAWGAQSYRGEQFWSTEPFLVVHFLLFLFISVQYTRQLVAQAPAMSLPTVDGSLLFGVPIAAFGLQAAMLKDQPLALAASAAVMAAVYLLVGRWLWRISGGRMLLMVEGLLALGVIFLLLVTPLALNAQWTGVAWAIQGAGIVWIGLRQKRLWAAGIGLLMQLAAAFSFWGVSDPWLRVQEAEAWLPFANSFFVSALVLGLAAIVTAFMAMRHRPVLAAQDGQSAWATAAHGVEIGMLALGLAQVFLGMWQELRVIVGLPYEPVALASLLGAMAGLLWLAAPRWNWPALNVAARVVFALALLSTFAALIEWLGGAERLWVHYAWRGNALVVVALVALGAWQLRRANPSLAAEPLLPAWAALLHGGAFAYAFAAWGVARHEGWAATAAVAVPTLMALWLLHREDRQAWPAVDAHRAALRLGLHAPWLALLALWVLGANLLSDGSMRPLPYLPLLNPTDLGHVLIALYAWKLLPRLSQQRALRLAGAALAFVWLNGLLVRSLHQWAGTPMWTEGALDADAVQTGLTILWTACAFITMWVATRRAERKWWMAGAALLAVVVAKLFFVDLSQVGTLARIVSFLAVGGLMLVIGYLSPMPPAQPEPQQEAA
jgi:uncharacterized membrane protein